MGSRLTRCPFLVPVGVISIDAAEYMSHGY